MRVGQNTMVRCTGRGGAGQHRGMSQKPSRENSHAMQNETRQTTPAAAFGRSSIKRLPPKLREAVDQAIADGATIDEITARIRAEGETCSRSAVGRYAKNHARHDPPAAGDRPHHQGVGGCAGRAPGGPHGAHPDRGPAGDGARHHGQPQRAGTSPSRRRSSPASPSPSSALKAPTSCA